MQGYELLEEKFSEWSGYKYAISVNSGTSALHLALLALGIGEGDEVIVPDFTFVACAFAVSYTGATPIFVDCDDTFNIDVSKIEEKITSKTKAIMGVHVYGRRCNMEIIKEISDKYYLHTIEDLSEGHGIKPTGDICCYSFQRTKIINCEEGGMIVTNNQSWADDMRLTKTLSNDGTYYHSKIGFNYRMSNLQAEKALLSLRMVNISLFKRRKKERELEKTYPIGKPRDVVWVYDCLASSEAERDKILIENPNYRYFFKPLSSLPMYNQKIGENALKFSKLGYIIPINVL